MEITVKNINFSYDLLGVTIGECDFMMQPEQQPDGTLLLRLSVVHKSGISVPLRVDEGQDIVWKHIGSDVEKAGISVQTYSP